MSHELFTADETGKLLKTASGELNGKGYDDNDVSLVRVAQRDYDKARKLPTELVAELSRSTGGRDGIWAKARAENDFKSFAPTLEQIIALKQRVAECMGYSDHAYGCDAGRLRTGTGPG